MMKTPLRKLKKSDIQWTIDRQKERIKITLRLAFNYLNDPEKKQRHAENYCVVCYYRESTMAGAAMTESQCGICEKELHWSSTHQEKLCHPCAILWNFCKECAGTLDLKEPRAIKTENFTVVQGDPKGEK